MTTSLNLNNINIDATGRVSLSGSASGIDTQAIIDATVASRRIQASRLEDTISANNSEISAFEQLQTLTTDLTESLDVLRGSNSFFADDVFDTRSGFLSATPVAGAPTGFTSTTPTALLTAAIDDGAQTGSSTIIVEQLARSNSLRSDAFSSSTLSLVDDLGLTGGDITINGNTISIQNDDSLIDLANTINNANIGVNASVVTASDTENFLVLTADETGTANAIQLSSGANLPAIVTVSNNAFADPALADGASTSNVVGFDDANIDESVINPTSAQLSSNPSGENVLRLGTGGITAQTTGSQFAANSIVRFEIDAAQAIGNSGGNFSIQIFDGTSNTELSSESFTIAEGDNFETFGVSVNTADFPASVGNDIRIRITSDAGEVFFDNIQVSQQPTGAAEELGLLQGGAIQNELRAAADSILTVNGITGVTRSTNTIDDVLQGVTLNLTQAEANTEITLDVETDLISVRRSIIDFVDAYNAIRDFNDSQRFGTDPDLTVDSDGDGNAANDGGFGPLANDPTLRSIITRLSNVVSSEVAGQADGFQSLAQIGIEIGADFRLSVDDDLLDTRLIDDVEELSQLFIANVTSTDNRVTFVQLADNTQNGDFFVNIDGTDATGNLLGGNISGTSGNGTANDGSLNLNGSGFTANNATGAEGLNLIIDAGPNSGPISDISININRGIADQLFYFFDDFSELGGTSDTFTDQLTERNITLQAQIAQIDARLEVTREVLERQFTALEAALSQLASLQETIAAFFQPRSDS